MVNLTKEQLDALHAMEGDLGVIQQEINRASEAGLDMGALQRQFDQVKALREGLLKVYGGVIRRRTIG